MFAGGGILLNIIKYQRQVEKTTHTLGWHQHPSHEYGVWIFIIEANLQNDSHGVKNVLTLMQHRGGMQKPLWDT
jgi:hypothetical protein